MGHLNNFVKIWDKWVVDQHNNLQMGDNFCSTKIHTSHFKSYISCCDANAENIQCVLRNKHLS